MEKTMADYITSAAGNGSAVILDRETREPVASVERSKGGATPNEGQWFAYPCPSHVDMMAYQHDRAAHAAVWAPTRREAAQAVLEHMGLI